MSSIYQILKFHMKNLIYVLSFFLLLSSCSKNSSSPESGSNYKRATAKTQQSFTVYGAGEKAWVTIFITFPENSKAKPSKITGVEVFSGNTRIFTIQSQDINSEYITPAFTYGFQTSELIPGINSFSYTFQYEDGHLQKGSTSVYAIKDKKIGTWWEQVSYDYLDTLSVFSHMATPIKDASEVKGGMPITYSPRQPNLALIDGLYGVVYPIFDNNKKLQAIYVYHGATQYELLLTTIRIKDEILAGYPDCNVTATTEGGYILKNATFTFRVYKNGENYFTEVKKNS